MTNKTAQYHYFAAIYKPVNTIGEALNPQRSIIGSLYCPSLKQAKAYLEANHPEARAILAKSASYQERSGTYPVLLGEPPANSRGAGRKPAEGRTMSISLCGVPDHVFEFLRDKAKQGEQSKFLIELIERHLAKI